MAQSKLDFWSSVVGLLGIILSIGGLLFMLPDLSTARLSDAILPVSWIVLAMIGCFAMFLYPSETVNVPDWFLTLGLATLNVALTIAFFMVPLLFLAFLLILIVASFLIRRLYGTNFAAIYLALPILAVAVHALVRHL